MMRPPTRSNRSNTESEMSEYNAKLLGKEEEKYAEMSENMGQFLSQRKRTISIGENLIPVQNVIRICALSIAVSVGYALNCISVITSMNNVVNHEPGENSLELWAILYVSSCFCLFILCFVLVLVSFIGIKFQIFLKLILYAFILGVGTQIFSLIIGFSFQNTHNYICYQFELLYPLLGLYIIFLIFFFESSNKYVRIFQIIAFSFVLFITPSLQLALNASIMPKSYLFACIAVMCAFILMLTHICCFLSTARQKLEWYLNKETLMLAQQSYNGKCFESEIFNNMWCIKLFPNGEEKDNIGQCLVGLQLCAYELNVDSMDIVWTITINEMNVKKTETTDKYDVLKGGTLVSIASLSDFNKCKEFEIIIDVIILKQYNKNNKEIETRSILKQGNYFGDEKKQMHETQLETGKSQSYKRTIDDTKSLNKMIEEKKDNNSKYTTDKLKKERSEKEKREREEKEEKERKQRKDIKSDKDMAVDNDYIK